MEEALAEAHFTVVTATNGKEGVELALLHKPDLILLDIRMPVMDGIEALKNIRKDPWGRTAKIIIMTAMDDVNNIATAHEARLDDYLIKTHTSLDELLTKVRMTLYS